MRTGGLGSGQGGGFSPPRIPKSMNIPQRLRRALVPAIGLLAVSAARATTYYVNSSTGSDSNNGTSSSTPWQNISHVNSITFNPGDSILFARGCSWTNQLSPQGSGTSTAPITIDAYGTGADPLIQASGAHPAALALSNQQYWEVGDLELTNTFSAGGTFYGVLISAQDIGAVEHIHLSNLTVHDVSGDPANKDTGGICFNITGSATATYFDDVLITGCYLYNITRTGIFLESSWSTRTATVNTNWTPSTNVVISDNVVSTCAANGVIWRVSSGPVLANNILADNAQSVSGNAMFVFNCDNAVMQDNEGYGTVYQSGYTDAAGFDDDYQNKGTVIQYNYSHDNGLGGIVAVAIGGFNQNAIIRYNILKNNQQQGFRIGGNVTNAAIYNNTIYLSGTLSNVTMVYHKSLSGDWPDGTTYSNNIIDNQSTTTTYSLGSSTNTTFAYNTFYGQHPASEPADAHKLTSDPLFLSPGSGGTGWGTNYGNELKPASPDLGSGTLISGNGGWDYFGFPVSATASPNRGAYGGPGVSSITVLQAFQNLDPVASSGQAVVGVSDSGATGGVWEKFEATATGQDVIYGCYLPAGTYQVQLRSKNYTDRGQVQLAVATSPTGTFTNVDSAKDEYAAAATWTTFTYTHTITVATGGMEYFRFTVAGKNASSSGYTISLDALTLTAQ